MPEHQIIPVLEVHQWLPEWDDYEYDPSAMRRKPEPTMYVFSMPALQLRELSDVYKRERTVSNAEGIQRAREDGRTARISRYVQYGYPFGDLNQDLRIAENWPLRKPGWLPTAIVANVLTLSDRRRGKSIEPHHLAKVVGGNEKRTLKVPLACEFSDSDLRPFEIIDGQHRLWAFEEKNERFEGFELPVVAFVGLDIAWQAYLFWSINISPKRINPSHAFDLYPLLRTQDWLEQTGEITVYREARAQEIVEWMYRFERSPWHGRINMLGRKGEARVSQAAWVRSLIGSFFGTGRGKGRFGLFQVAATGQERVLSWIRPQQIAFLVELWTLLQRVVEQGDTPWIEFYRADAKCPFTDKSSMLNQDMGVRAVHAVVNDVFFGRCGDWELEDWTLAIEDETSTEADDIEQALVSLRECDFYDRLEHLSSVVAIFDWRSLDGPRVRKSGDEMLKRAYRGNGGFSLLVEQLLEHLVKVGDLSVGTAAIDVSDGESTSG